MTTDAEIQIIASDIYDAVRGIMTTKYSHLDLRDGWVVLVSVSLSMLAMYLDAVESADRESARKDIIRALKQRTGDLH